MRIFEVSKGNNHLKLLAAMKDRTREEISQIIKISPYSRRLQYLDKEQTIIWRASDEDLEYALRIAPKTFKVNQSSKPIK
jgi:hypothetical protein